MGSESIIWKKMSLTMEETSFFVLCEYITSAQISDTTGNYSW